MIRLHQPFRRFIATPALVIMIVLAVAASWANSLQAADEDARSGSASKPETVAEALQSAAESLESFAFPEFEDIPFDFQPYRVLVWIASDDPEVSADNMSDALQASLDRDFDALWRTTIADMPPAAKALMIRDAENLSYDRLVAADPVWMIRKSHPKAVSIRTPKNVGEFIVAMGGQATQIKTFRDQLQADAPELAEVFRDKWRPLDDGQTIQEYWESDAAEAVLTTRARSETLVDPKGRLIEAPVQTMATTIDQFDKIFFVRVIRRSGQPHVLVREMDVLMRHLGSPRSIESESPLREVAVATVAITDSFRPVVRIDEAGRKSARGRIRGGGLIVDPDSPAAIRENDILEPMIRKDDRRGVPFAIGPLDWSFLVVTGAEQTTVEADYWSGRAGGLSGRRNSRTYRMALRVRPRGRSSELRLHAKGDPNTPLIGYEIHEKGLESGDWTFIGRTDWDGRLNVDPGDNPFRLLYVKNGGAVLARLPLVPGLHETDVADLTGDDDRLQAEAYIRGVQSSIVDLVAVRALFQARINLRLERGEMDKAMALMETLRKQPVGRELADQLAKAQKNFITTIKNPSQRKKVDNLFSETRELLTQFIQPKLINDLEANLIRARNNGGRLPPTPKEKPKQDPANAGS